MGLPLSAGALVFETLGVRPLRTSWLIVGTLVFSVLSGVAASGHSLVRVAPPPGPRRRSPGRRRRSLNSRIAFRRLGARPTVPRHAKMWHTLHKNPANRKRRSGSA